MQQLVVSGEFCERARCQEEMCENGGRCIVLGDKAACYCPPGFTGPKCQVSQVSYIGNKHSLWHMYITQTQIQPSILINKEYSEATSDSNKHNTVMPSGCIIIYDC